MDDDDKEDDVEIEETKEESTNPAESIVAFKNLLIKVLTDNELD